MPGRALLDERLHGLAIAADETTQISDAEAVFLFDFVQRHRSARTLEVGCGLGKSAVAIMTATGAPHVVIDPFQANYEERGLGNIRAAGLGDLLEFLAEPSHVALPALLAEGRRFDFVFIDGGHRFDQIFVDFYYADLLLEPDGCIVFDDLWMRTTRLVLAWVTRNRPDYRTLPSDLPRRVSAIQKVGVDTRDGMSHREFYTTRSLLSHYGNLWLSSPDQTPLRRNAQRVKRRLIG
jgi:predicted O-methyltransferase YrrM